MGATLSRPVFLLVGTLYPGYGTFKALESRNVRDVKQWLAYWIVHAAVRGGEFAVGGAVRGVLPFYNVCKLALIAWLVHPRHRGALYCYSTFVRPYLVKHQRDIDNGLSHAHDVVSARTRAVSERTLQWLEQKKKETVEYVTHELKKAAVETIAGNSEAAQLEARGDDRPGAANGTPESALNKSSRDNQSGGEGSTPVSKSP